MRAKRSVFLAAMLLGGTLATAPANPAIAKGQPPGATANSMPKVGAVAPDFTLKYFDGNDLKDVSLSQYRGKKNVVVAFFIFAFTGG
jgi:AhpC/TSA family